MPPQRAWVWADGIVAYPLSRLHNLLHDPEHPAQLVVDGDRRQILYIHVWNKQARRYQRAFHALFEQRKTYGGIRSQFDSDTATTSHRYSLGITQEEWSLLGASEHFHGALFEWAASEIARDPVHFLGEAAPFLHIGDIEVRKKSILELFRRCATPGDARRSASLHLDMATCHKTNRIAVKIFEADDPLNNPTYAHQLNVNEEDDGGVQEMQHHPMELVKSSSINDCRAIFIGFVMSGMSWKLITRVTHIVRERGALPPPQPVQERRIAAAAAIAMQLVPRPNPAVARRVCKRPDVFQDTPSVDEKSDCKICMVNTANMLTTPCEHASLCNACARKIADEDNPTCPFCRTAIEHIFRIRMM